MSITDYFALDRPRVWLPLSAPAVAARFKHADPHPRGSWHPHVEINPRPTQGARQWLLEHTKGLDETIRKVRTRVMGEVALAMADITDEEKAARIAKANEAEVAEALGMDEKITTWSQYLEAETQTRVWLDNEVSAEAQRINSLKVAVHVRRLGGDWNCYADAWRDFGANPDTEDRCPEWPALTSDPDTLDVRLAVVFNLAEDDVKAICAAIAPREGLSKEEMGKSEAPQP